MSTTATSSRRYSRDLEGTLMTPEEALMTILRLIDGSGDVNVSFGLQY
jgi:hypothetical protein